MWRKGKVRQKEKVKCGEGASMIAALRNGRSGSAPFHEEKTHKRNWLASSPAEGPRAARSKKPSSPI